MGKKLDEKLGKKFEEFCTNRFFRKFVLTFKFGSVRLVLQEVTNIYLHFIIKDSWRRNMHEVLDNLWNKVTAISLEFWKKNFINKKVLEKLLGYAYTLNLNEKIKQDPNLCSPPIWRIRNPQRQGHLRIFARINQKMQQCETVRVKSNPAVAEGKWKANLIELCHIATWAMSF